LNNGGENVENDESNEEMKDKWIMVGNELM